MGADAMIGMMQSGMTGGGMMTGTMGVGMWLGWLVPLLLLAGLGLLVSWGVRTLGGDSPAGRREGDALRIVRRRYARGEIDRETFRTLRSDLETA